VTLDQRIRAVDRNAAQSLTAQLVDAVTEAIASGELSAGEKLPPTRSLAALAGVNQLTASRAYHRLQEVGAVVSEVGRGTFVRTAAYPGQHPNAADDASWQTYLLPAEAGGESGRILGELARHVDAADTIPLSMGYPPDAIIPLELLREASARVLARLGALSFAYGPVEGTHELRAELAKLGRERGLDDDPDSIVVTTGARQGISLVTRALLRPGDKVACESPTFMGNIEALNAVEAQLLPVPVDEHGLDVAALEQLLRRHEIRLVVVQPRAHNPTGFDLSKERRLQLISLARQHGFFILEDAVYADLRFEGEDLGPLRAIAPTHVIYVDSFSKTFGPGLRAGWIAASGPVLERLINEKRNADTHSATLPQQIVAEFLAGGHYAGQVKRARAMFRQRRDALVQALEEELSAFGRFTRPVAGGHVWLTLDQACDDARLYREALAAGVAILPGRVMLVDRPHSTHLRLSYCRLEPALIREGVGRLAGVVRALHAAPYARQSLPLN
jgi:DNA-binding transcriptional MocR family regulator